MMAIRAQAQNGFIETEIGELPAEWEVVSLSRVTERISNRNPSNEPEKPFQYIDVSSVSNETFRIVDFSVLSGKEAPSRARRVVRADDTIFATVRPYLKNIAQVPPTLDDAICSTGFCVIRAKRTTADPDFLYFYSIYEPFVQRAGQSRHGRFLT